jgi:ribosomal protein L11 methyltransferase
MSYYEIEFPLAGMSPETVETALQDQGAASITFLDRGDEPVLEPRPGEVRLWSDTLVRALFDADLDPAMNLHRLAAVLGEGFAAAARVRGVENRAWERAWLADWKSMRFGPHLWVCPTTADPPGDPAAIVVRLDPGLAFGTGTHPTTALCLEGLSGLDLASKSIIDYGCGSGILAIAALKLGAAAAICIDIDPQALLASRENARLNGVSERLLAQPAGAALSRADCVVANILAGPLVELEPALRAACKPGADLLLSGILATQADAVLAAYRPAFELLENTFREDWCCIHARLRPIPE